MLIRLPDIWQISKPDQYKLHFARRSGITQPLEVLARSKLEWQGWQEYRPKRDEFNRPLIFSLVQFYHEPDTWLFGGVFRVLRRHDDRYEVELTDEGAALCGRLKLKSDYRQRATRVNFESHYPNLIVNEILREHYTGTPFPGFENIDLTFEELETIVQNSQPEWKAPLANIKGIYLITDTATGKRYVGSAYSDQGIYSRWCEYASSGHGGNAELVPIVIKMGLEYCRKSFRFTLLEARSVATPDDTIFSRESFWKQILLTRGEFGLNRN